MWRCKIPQTAKRLLKNWDEICSARLYKDLIKKYFKNSEVLVQGQANRPVEENEEPRNTPLQTRDIRQKWHCRAHGEETKFKPPFTLFTWITFNWTADLNIKGKTKSFWKIIWKINFITSKKFWNFSNKIQKALIKKKKIGRLDYILIKNLLCVKLLTTAVKLLGHLNVKKSRVRISTKVRIMVIFGVEDDVGYSGVFWGC